jgi:hypothetical protein
LGEVQQVFVAVTDCPQLVLVIVNKALGPIIAVPPLQAPPHVSVNPLLYQSEFGFRKLARGRVSPTADIYEYCEANIH